jgi:hypothetical protein
MNLNVRMEFFVNQIQVIFNLKISNELIFFLVQMIPENPIGVVQNNIQKLKINF